MLKRRPPFLNALLVECLPNSAEKVTPEIVPPGAKGDFLSSVFDEGLFKDIGRTKIQIIEEADCKER